MKRPESSFARLFADIQAKAAQQHWRYLLVLAGSSAWGRSLCYSVQQLQGEHTLWVGEDFQASWHLSAGDGLSLLGAETDNIVFDAWGGFHPDAFAALSGTVKAGGLLVLLTPPLAQWSGYDDPDYQRMAVAGFTQPHRNFLTHLGTTLRQDTQCLLVEENEALPGFPAGNSSNARKGLVDDSGSASEDQAKAVAAIQKVVTGHRNRPLVITSDRGRGKSAALGIAAANMMRGPLHEVILTAPLRRNVESVFKHAALLLDGVVVEGSQLLWQGRSLRFLPPDALLREKPKARLLLVDEAAAIPTPLLSRMLDHYHRVVFTSTVHGYEGTGRGFAVRFLAELGRRCPQWVNMRLQQPIRWGVNDPLEALVSKLCYLHAEPAAEDCLADVSLDQLKFELINRRRLLLEPELMEQLVGLLTLAHYRTTPDDIRILLDAPNGEVLLASSGGNVVGAVLVSREGALAGELVAGVRNGARRPRGHLLPQALWAQTGNSSLLERPGWRVVRIAVHPAVQRQGIGLGMLDKLQSLAAEQGVDYLGSSFGASSELVAFWCRGGYQPVALGWRRDASSGSYGLLVLRGLDQAVIRLVDEERMRFASKLPILLSDQLALLEANVVASLAQALGAELFPLQERDRQDLQDFVVGARSYEHCAPALSFGALERLAQTGADELAEPASSVLVARVLQQHGWTEVAQQNGLSGKKQVVQQLRDALQGLN